MRECRYTSKRYVSIAMLTLLATTALGCKPKAGSGDLKTITGLDADGNEVALALLSLRNFTPTALTSKNAKTKVGYVETIARMPYFALVQCVATTNPDTLSAAQWMDVAEKASFLSNLWLSSERRLYMRRADKEAALPCAVVGTRLASYNVLADGFFRTLGIPAAKPADAAQVAAAGRTYMMAQGVYLALRGTYTPGQDPAAAPMLSKLVTLSHAQDGYDPEKFNKVQLRFKDADAYYNPCVGAVADSMPWYVKEWRGKNFSCAPFADGTNKKVFRAGSTDGFTFTQVRDLLAAEMAATHADYYGLLEDDKTAYYKAIAWDVLTTTAKWSSLKGRRGDLGTYLSGGALAGKTLAGILGSEAGLALAGDDGADGGPANVELTEEIKRELAKVTFNPYVERAGSPQTGFALAGAGTAARRAAAAKSAIFFPTTIPRQNGGRTTGIKDANGNFVAETGLGTERIRLATSQAALDQMLPKFQAQDANNFIFAEKTYHGDDLYTNKAGDQAFVVQDAQMKQARDAGILGKTEALGNTIQWDKVAQSGSVSQFEHSIVDTASRGAMHEYKTQGKTGGEKMAYDIGGTVVTGNMAKDRFGFAMPDEELNAAAARAYEQKQIGVTGNLTKAQQENDAATKSLAASTQDSSIMQQVEARQKAYGSAVAAQTDAQRALDLARGVQETRLESTTKANGAVHEDTAGAQKARADALRADTGGLFGGFVSQPKGAGDITVGGPSPYAAGGGTSGTSGATIGGIMGSMRETADNTRAETPASELPKQTTPFGMTTSPYGNMSGGFGGGTSRSTGGGGNTTPQAETALPPVEVAPPPAVVPSNPTPPMNPKDAGWNSPASPF